MKKDVTTNQFTDGIVMDLNPLATPNTVLTQCLNGTLITYNGNENILQNDLGNGRVETAYLPEGYIPVGTCSFGGIIYIVSYNPLTKRSQIGSFPSPQRNIESTSISLQEKRLNPLQDTEENEPTGKFKTYSEKLELTEDNLNPGDKFIVTSSNLDGTYLSDYGNTSHIDGDFPKLWKLQLALLETSGKFTILDNVKWYSTDFHVFEVENLDKDGIQKDVDSLRSLVNSPYTIVNSKKSGKLVLIASPEVIDGFSCTWGISASREITNDEKVETEYDLFLNFGWDTPNNNINISSIKIEDITEYPNKVKSPFNNLKSALLIDRIYEPEKLQENKSISYESFKAEFDYNSKLVQSQIKKLDPWNKEGETYSFDELKEKYGDISISPIRVLSNQPTLDYVSDGEYLVNCTDSFYKGDEIYYLSKKNDKYKILSPVKISDDIVNNYFNKNIRKYFASVLKSDNITLKLRVTPCMPSGEIEYLSQEITIDLSKIGQKDIAVNKWKYYTYTDTLMLNWGLRAYTEPNKGIKDIHMEFWDNLGLAAIYHVPAMDSYNGQFVNYINLNGNSNYYNIDGRKHNSEELFFHPGSNTPVLGRTLYEESEDSEDSDQPIINFEGMVYFYHKDQSITYIDDNTFPNLNEFIQCTEDNFKDWKDKYVWVSDAGVLYGSALYLVKIKINYTSIDSFGRYDELSQSDDLDTYRWLWTNRLFNDSYELTDDFVDLNPRMAFDLDVKYFQTGEFKYNKGTYSNISTVSLEEKTPKDTLSAIVQEINSQKEVNNVSANVGIVFQDNFETFTIDDKKLDQITISAYMPEGGKAVNSPESPKFIQEKPDNNVELVSPKVAETWNNTLTKKLAEVLKLDISESSEKELWEEGHNKEVFKNTATIKFFDQLDSESTEITYMSNEELKTATTIGVSKTFKDIFDNKDYFRFYFGAKHFSKYYTVSTVQEVHVQIAKSFILTSSDLPKNNLGITDQTDQTNQQFPLTGVLYCPYIIGIGRNHSGKHSRTVNDAVLLRFDNSLDPFFAEEPADEYKESATKTLSDIAIHQDVIPAYKKKVDYDFVPVWINNSARNGSVDGWDLVAPYIARNNKRIILSERYQIAKKPLSIRAFIGSQQDGITRGNHYGGMLGIAFDDTLCVDNRHPISAVKPSEYKPGYPSPWYDYFTVRSDQDGSSIRIYDNIVTHFARYLFSLLVNTFYLTSDTENTSISTNDSYTYLEDNIFTCNSDIIYKTSHNEDNDFLLMRGLGYMQYIENIKERVGKVDINDSNIKILIDNCTKTFPLSFNIEYITPTLDRANLNNTVIMKSAYSNVSTQIVNVSAESKDVLWYDGKNSLQKLTARTIFPLMTVEDHFDASDIDNKKILYQMRYNENQNIDSTSVNHQGLNKYIATEFFVSPTVCNYIYNDNGRLKIDKDITTQAIPYSETVNTGSDSQSDIPLRNCVQIFYDCNTDRYVDDTWGGNTAGDSRNDIIVDI